MLGIDPALFATQADDSPTLWRWHVPALQAFMAVRHQWRTAVTPMGLRYLGLDHTAVAAGLTLAGITVTPEVCADEQMIEAGARDVLNGG